MHSSVADLVVDARKRNLGVEGRHIGHGEWVGMRRAQFG